MPLVEMVNMSYGRYGEGASVECHEGVRIVRP